MKNKIIEAQDLTKIYKKSVKAVDDISFSVEEGEIFGSRSKRRRKNHNHQNADHPGNHNIGKSHCCRLRRKKIRRQSAKAIGMVPQELTADDELKGHREPASLS